MSEGSHAGGDASTATGGSAFDALLDAVDFPDFVAGLVKAVYQAVVDASVQQMEAYGELLDDVAASVGKFVEENVAGADDRDWLSDLVCGRPRKQA